MVLTIMQKTDGFHIFGKSEINGKALNIHETAKNEKAMFYKMQMIADHLNNEWNEECLFEID